MGLLQKVPPETFKSLGNLVRQRIYTTPNPLVRWIFWNRLAVLLNLADGRSFDSILDCGCGEGALLPSLSKLSQRVTAIDLDTRAAERLTQHFRLPNVTVRQASVDRLPFPDASFDAVFSADVLEHIPVLEPALAEINRVLKPGGSFFVSAPTENLVYVVGRAVFGFTKPADHYRTARDIEELIARGLRISAKRYFPLNVAEAVSGFVLLRATKD
jgi:2-polyprenyl-3-methyl-5-hydroxy-6-metoxy-1,4-benzoquinol methylase